MNGQTKSFLDTIVHKKAFDDEKLLVVSVDVPKETVIPSSSSNSKSKTNPKEIFKYKEHQKKRLFSRLGLVTISFLSILLVLAVTFFVYGYFYQDKVFLGVEVMGQNVGGKNEEEVARILGNKINNYQLTIKDDRDSFSVGFTDLGISYDTTYMASEATKYGRSGNYFENIAEQAKGFLSEYKLEVGPLKLTVNGREIESKYKLDEKKLSMYLIELEGKLNIQAKDSVISNVGSRVQISPAVFGKKIETAKIKERILSSATILSSTPINVSAQVVAPSVLDEKTTKLASEAEAIAAKSVILTYQDKKFVPTKETVMGWITFGRENETSGWKMMIDSARMYGYFDTIGNGINIWPVAKKVRVENGVKETVTQEGSDGLLIDKQKLGQSISAGLLSQASVTTEIPMYTAPYKTEKENIVVANWEKYIDVNISTQTMCAYLAGGEKVNCWSVTTGATGLGHYTPTGTHLIQRKSGEGGAPGAYGGGVCMPNPPYKAPLCGINYVSYFTSAGHAIHEAWWRSVFGVNPAYTGSHGCVNATYDIAKFIFYWAPIGTPVVVHY